MHPTCWRGGESTLRLSADPSSIDVRIPGDRPRLGRITPLGWQRDRMENFNALTSGRVIEEDLVMDGWTEIIRNLISMANYRGKNLQGKKSGGS